MNVKINEAKARKANMIRAMENKLQETYIAQEFKLNKFKSKIRKPDGKLTIGDLHKLNSVYRGAYVK